MPDNPNIISYRSHLADIFWPVYQSQCYNTAPSTQAKICSTICDPVFNKYWGTGS